MRIFNFQFSSFKLFAAGYLFVVIGLFFYSFTQVDLGLTLSQWSVWQVFQNFFQQIGYFHRPLSTFFYITLLTLLYVFYGAILTLVKKNMITKRQIWILMLGTSVILSFAYNAFSYDLFNYIFDAKIVTFYHQNPYEHKAFDYPGNPMLGFMHWTGRTYPYGPVWLLITVPLGMLDGFRLLLPTMMLFKGLAFVCFLGIIYFLKKILGKISPQDQLFGMAFFAFNPLILIESLVSAHNDVVMMFFAVASFYALIEKKYFLACIMLLFSIGIKFATVFLVPIFLFVMLKDFFKKKIDWKIIIYALIVSMIVPVVVVSLRTNFQPWYLLYVLPFAAMLAKKYFVFIPVIVITLFALLQYMPFLYLGNWDPPVPIILQSLTISSIAVSFLFSFAWYVKSYTSSKKA